VTKRWRKRQDWRGACGVKSCEKVGTAKRLEEKNRGRPGRSAVGTHAEGL